MFPDECVMGTCEIVGCKDCAKLASYGSSVEAVSCEYFSEGLFEGESAECGSAECGSSDEWSGEDEWEEHGICCADLWEEDKMDMNED